MDLVSDRLPDLPHLTAREQEGEHPFGVRHVRIDVVYVRVSPRS